MIDCLRIELDVSIRYDLISASEASAPLSSKWKIFVPYDATVRDLSGAVASRLLLAKDIPFDYELFDTLIFGVFDDQNFSMEDRPVVVHIQDAIARLDKAETLKRCDPSVREDMSHFKFDLLRMKCMESRGFNKNRFRFKDLKVFNPDALLPRLKAAATITTQR